MPAFPDALSDIRPLPKVLFASASLTPLFLAVCPQMNQGSAPRVQTLVDHSRGLTLDVSFRPIPLLQIPLLSQDALV